MSSGEERISNPSDASIVICLSDDDGDGDGGGGSQKENVESNNGDRPRGVVDLPDSKKGASGIGGPSRVSASPTGEAGREAIGAAASLDNDGDDVVEVVDGEPRRARPGAASARPTTATATEDDGDEELEIVGTHNEQRLPHNRQDCLECRYVPAGDDTRADDSNARYCGLCYCYVCDRPAFECEDWYMGRRGKRRSDHDDDSVNASALAKSDSTPPPPPSSSSSGDGDRKDDDGDHKNVNGGAGKAREDDGGIMMTRLLPHRNHCHATDRGPRGTLWKNMRAAVKGGRDPSLASSSRDESSSAVDDPLRHFMANYYGGAFPSGGGAASSLRFRVPATARGGARQERHDYGGAGGGEDSVYGSTTHQAAAAAAMVAAAASVARGAPSRGRQRSRPVEGRGGSAGRKRPAPHDHRDRIRTQQMLEDLYG